MRSVAEIQQAVFRGLDHFTNGEMRIMLAELERARNPAPPKPMGPKPHNPEMDRIASEVRG